MTALALAVVWVAGLRFLWRSGRPLWRALAWAYALLFVFFALTTGGKIYYLAGAYIYLLAAGAVAIDGWLAARRPGSARCCWPRRVTTALAVPLVLPVLPAGDLGGTEKINAVLAESVGWPQLVELGPHGVVLAAGQPARQRGHLHVELRRGQRDQRTGQGTGLPQAVSGHNTYWWWGPGNPRATTVVAVMPGQWTAAEMPPTSASSSPACGPSPRCPTRTACTTRSGTVTSTCAPARAAPGARCGRSYASTADAAGRTHPGRPSPGPACRSRADVPAVRLRSRAHPQRPLIDQGSHDQIG